MQHTFILSMECVGCSSYYEEKAVEVNSYLQLLIVTGYLCSSPIHTDCTSPAKVKGFSWVLKF